MQLHISEKSQWQHSISNFKYYVDYESGLLFVIYYWHKIDGIGGLYFY
jgi:hypothetical protein